MGNPTRSNQVCDADITITDNGSGSFTAAIQLKGPNGNDLTSPAWVGFYLSTDSAGMVAAADSTDSSEIAIATDGLLQEHLTDVEGDLVSEADGDIGLTITVIEGKTVYLVLKMPDGTLIISDAMSYA